MSDEVYVVIGTSGEYSGREVWVAGAYTDKDAAVQMAEKQKEEDRANWAIWSAWSREFGKRLKEAGHSGGFVGFVGTSWREERAKAVIDVAMPDEPPSGNHDSGGGIGDNQLDFR